MVTYEEAYEIAKSREPARVVSASRLPDGWVFGYRQSRDEDGLVIPGGPHPLAVFENGRVQIVAIPLPEASDLMDRITERNLPLPDGNGHAS